MTDEKKKKKNKKGKKSNKLTAIQQRELETSIRQYKGKGFSDLEILEKLNLQPHVYKQYLARIHDIDRENFTGLDSVKVYSEFVEKSRALVKDLDKMQKRFDYRKQFTALVAAVKMKHDINKDVVKLGQQLGFIENKGGDKISVEAEMTFTTMTTEDVKREVENEMARLNNMASQPIIEMRPELLASLEGDEQRIRKFIPDNIFIPEEKEKTKTKIKTKVKLKRRK